MFTHSEILDRTRRLGNLKDGASDVKKHKFFKGIDWDALANKHIRPPIIPPVEHEGDTSNFEKYEEEGGYDYCLNDDVTDPYADTFANF